MKTTHLLLLPLGAAVAQSSNASTTASPKISTVTFTSCSSSGGSTSTGTTTVTEPCGECESMAGESRTGSYHYTTWTTAYTMPCAEASGAEYRTMYTATVTESCTEATPTFTSGPNYVPQGWTSAMVTCTACGSTPLSTMATFPTAAMMPSGVMGPAPVPAPAPAPASASPGWTSGSAPMPMGSAAAPASAPSELRQSPEASPSPTPSGCSGEECVGGAGGSSSWAPESPAAPGAAAPTTRSSEKSSATMKHMSSPTEEGRVVSTTVCAGSMLSGGVCATPTVVQMTERPGSSEARTGSWGEATPMMTPEATSNWYKGAGAMNTPVLEIMGALLAVGVGAGLL